MSSIGVFLLLCLLAETILPGSGRGVLSIKLLSFANGSGRTYEGHCCDPTPQDDEYCYNQCDYVMRLIISGLGRANDHVFLFHRPLKYDSNNLQFQQHGGGLTLTVFFDSWPTKGQVKMNAFFYDYDDFDHTTALVDWFETELNGEASAGQDAAHRQTLVAISGNRRSDKTRLEFEWLRRCDRNTLVESEDSCYSLPSEWQLFPLKDDAQYGDSDNHDVGRNAGKEHKQSLLLSNNKEQSVFYPNNRHASPLMKSPFKPFSTRKQKHDPDLTLYTPNPEGKQSLTYYTPDAGNNELLKMFQHRHTPEIKRTKSLERFHQKPLKTNRYTNLDSDESQAHKKGMAEEVKKLLGNDADSSDMTEMGPYEKQVGINTEIIRNPYHLWHTRKPGFLRSISMSASASGGLLANAELYGKTPRDPKIRMQHTMLPPNFRKQRNFATFQKAKRYPYDTFNTTKHKNNQNKAEESMTHDSLKNKRRTPTNITNTRSALDTEDHKITKISSTPTLTVKTKKEEMQTPKAPRKLHHSPPVHVSRSPKTSSRTKSIEDTYRITQASDVRQQKRKRVKFARKHTQGHQSSTTKIIQKKEIDISLHDLESTNANVDDISKKLTVTTFNNVSTATESTVNSTRISMTLQRSGIVVHSKLKRPSYRSSAGSFSTKASTIASAKAIKLLQPKFKTREFETSTEAMNNVNTVFVNKTQRTPVTTRHGWGPLQKNRFITWIPKTANVHWFPDQMLAFNDRKDKHQIPELQNPFASKTRSLQNQSYVKKSEDTGITIWKKRKPTTRIKQSGQSNMFNSQQKAKSEHRNNSKIKVVTSSRKNTQYSKQNELKRNKNNGTAEAVASFSHLNTMQGDVFDADIRRRLYEKNKHTHEKKGFEASQANSKETKSAQTYKPASHIISHKKRPQLLKTQTKSSLNLQESSAKTETKHLKSASVVLKQELSKSTLPSSTVTQGNRTDKTKRMRPFKKLKSFRRKLVVSSAQSTVIRLQSGENKFMLEHPRSEKVLKGGITDLIKPAEKITTSSTEQLPTNPSPKLQVSNITLYYKNNSFASMPPKTFSSKPIDTAEGKNSRKASKSTWTHTAYDQNKMSRYRPYTAHEIMQTVAPESFLRNTRHKYSSSSLLGQLKSGRQGLLNIALTPHFNELDSVVSEESSRINTDTMVTPDVHLSTPGNTDRKQPKQSVQQNSPSLKTSIARISGQQSHVLPTTSTVINLRYNEHKTHNTNSFAIPESNEANIKHDKYSSLPPTSKNIRDSRQDKLNIRNQLQNSGINKGFTSLVIPNKAKINGRENKHHSNIAFTELAQTSKISHNNQTITQHTAGQWKESTITDNEKLKTPTSTDHISLLRPQKSKPAVPSINDMSNSKDVSSVREESMKRMRTQTFRTPTAVMEYIARIRYSTTIRPVSKPNIDIRFPANIKVGATVHVKSKLVSAHPHERKYHFSSTKKLKDHENTSFGEMAKHEKNKVQKEKRHRFGGLRSRLQMVAPIDIPDNPDMIKAPYGYTDTLARAYANPNSSLINHQTKSPMKSNKFNPVSDVEGVKEYGTRNTETSLVNFPNNNAIQHSTISAATTSLNRSPSSPRDSSHTQSTFYLSQLNTRALSLESGFYTSQTVTRQPYFETRDHMEVKEYDKKKASKYLQDGVRKVIDHFRAKLVNKVQKGKATVNDSTQNALIVGYEMTSDMKAILKNNPGSSGMQRNKAYHSKDTSTRITKHIKLSQMDALNILKQLEEKAANNNVSKHILDRQKIMTKPNSRHKTKSSLFHNRLKISLESPFKTTENRDKNLPENDIVEVAASSRYSQSDFVTPDPFSKTSRAIPERNEQSNPKNVQSQTPGVPLHFFVTPLHSLMTNNMQSQFVFRQAKGKLSAFLTSHGNGSVVDSALSTTQFGKNTMSEKNTNQRQSQNLRKYKFDQNSRVHANMLPKNAVIHQQTVKTTINTSPIFRNDIPFVRSSTRHPSKGVADTKSSSKRDQMPLTGATIFSKTIRNVNGSAKSANNKINVKKLIHELSSKQTHSATTVSVALRKVNVQNFIQAGKNFSQTEDSLSKMNDLKSPTAANFSSLNITSFPLSIDLKGDVRNHTHTIQRTRDVKSTKQKGPKPIHQKSTLTTNILSTVLLIERKNKTVPLSTTGSANLNPNLENHPQRVSPSSVQFFTTASISEMAGSTRHRSTSATANSSKTFVSNFTWSPIPAKPTPTTTHHFTQTSRIPSTVLRQQQSSVTWDTVSVPQSKQEQKHAHYRLSNPTAQKIQRKHANIPDVFSGEHMTDVLQSLRKKIDTISTTIKELLYTTTSMRFSSSDSVTQFPSLSASVPAEDNWPVHHSSLTEMSGTLQHFATMSPLDETTLPTEQNRSEANNNGSFLFSLSVPQMQYSAIDAATVRNNVIPFTTPKLQTGRLPSFQNVSIVLSKSLETSHTGNPHFPTTATVDTRKRVTDSGSVKPTKRNLNFSQGTKLSERLTAISLITIENSSTNHPTKTYTSSVQPEIIFTTASVPPPPVGSSEDFNAVTLSWSSQSEENHSVQSSTLKSSTILTPSTTVPIASTSSIPTIQSKGDGIRISTSGKSPSLKQNILTLPDWLTFPNQFNIIQRKEGKDVNQTSSTTDSLVTSLNELSTSAVPSPLSTYLKTKMVHDIKSNTKTQLENSKSIKLTTQKLETKSPNEKVVAKHMERNTTIEKSFLKNMILNKLIPEQILSEYMKKNKSLSQAGYRIQARKTDVGEKKKNIDATGTKQNSNYTKNSVAKNNPVLSILDSFKEIQNSSEPGPKVMVPKKGLYVPRVFQHSNTVDINNAHSTGGRTRYGTGHVSGSEARHESMRSQQMSVETVFNRYWPAILGLTVGTVFLVMALLTSIACRQQRLLVQRRQHWRQDTPQHLTSPPDTSVYSSSSSSLSSENTHTSSHFT